MNRSSLYFTGEQSVDLREGQLREREDEVLIETQVSAISPGTELLIYNDEAPTNLEADLTLDALDGDLSYPVNYGYAAVGEVIATGAAVEDEWIGKTVFGFNPHETYFSASPADLIELPKEIPPEAMALYPTAETATNLVMDGEPRVGERVGVFGAGVVGLSTINLLGSFPLADLIAIDPLEKRRDLAEKLGADETFHPEEISKDRWGDSSGPEGADLIYELSGNPAALDGAIAIAGYDSRIVVGSWYGSKSTTANLGGNFHRDRLSIESSQVSTLDPSLRGRFTFDRRTEIALDTLRSLPTEELITHRIPFNKAPVAYERLDEKPDQTLQVLLTYDGWDQSKTPQ